jgi:hypothetical protein
MLDQSLENVMQIQTKLFSVGGTKNHVVMIARGLLNANGPKQILRELTAVTIRCVDCKVLIDFIDAEYQVKDPEIDQLLCDARPDLLLTQCKTALLSSFKRDHHVELSAIGTSLARCGFRVAVFHNSKSAFDWLNTA